jgi:hypothetical protein
VPPDGRSVADEREERRFLATWMAIGLLLILVAAVRSEGFHHPDEHFQVLEFAGAKLGLTPWSALAWEYRDQMRPWLQAALYTLGARGLAWPRRPRPVLSSVVP